MKYLFILLMALIVAPLYGDEPPCWCEFAIYSDNGHFKAKIVYSEPDFLKEPWERKWRIKVYQIKQDTTLLWESEFLNAGYGAGLLTNDGKFYVYVNDWLEMSFPNQVVLYSENEIKQLSGENLNLNPSRYPHTVSHQVWLDKYYFEPNYSTDTTFLVIKTLDSNIITLSVKDLSLSLSTQRTEYLSRNIMLKIYGLMVIVVCLGILLNIDKLKRIKQSNSGNKNDIYYFNERSAHN